MKARPNLPVLLVLALALAVPRAGGELRAAAPQEVNASYHVLVNGGHVAVMNETFEARDNTYRIVSESSAVGLLALFENRSLRFVSSGQLTGSGLRPRHFEGKRGEAERRQVRAEFDWEARQLTLAHDGRSETVPLPPDTQDQLSMMYQFMFHTFERPAGLVFPMTNGRKLDHYRYTIHPDVEIDTPLGRMKTLHLVKQREPDQDGTEIWLAPQHRYLRVRMLIHENDGSRYEQIIVKLEFKP